jgi:(2Fe-2S) ferredoxin/trans-aconitate methyltransferase
MTPFRYHVFCCDQRKPEGAPSCPAHGSQAVIDALRREVASRKLSDAVAVTTCGSLGMCENGPNLVVYPEGVWYSHVTPADVPEIVSSHFEGGHPVERLMRKDEAALKQEISGNRAKFMAGVQAREAAGTVPDELSETVRGYMPSRVVLTGLELDVFTTIARVPSATPATAANLASALKADLRATTTLLDALVALGLLAKRGGAYSNTPNAARYLVSGSKDDATNALKHNLSLWQTWSTLTEVVRTGHIVDRGEMDSRSQDWTTPFIAAMHKNAALRAPMVVKAVGTDGVRKMIDIGGGSGAYSIAFAQANPALQVDVFDLATVVPIASGHIAAAGLADRVRTRIGDLRRDAFGAGYDLALLSAICHMLGPDENRDLLRRVFACLAPGGRVAIQDHVMQDDKTSPRAGALFAVNMLVGTPRGSTFSLKEYSDWLAEAGFEAPAQLKLGGPNDLLVAKRR